MKEVYFLRCRECGKKYSNAPQSFCEECFSPLEVSYDYEALGRIAKRERLAHRAFNMWRYSELLPLAGRFHSGRGGRRHAAGAIPQARRGVGRQESVLQE